MSPLFRVFALFMLVLSGPALAQKTAPASARVVPIDARASGVTYPFLVHTLPLRAQGQALEMAYMDIGEKTAPAVLLLHGKNFSGAYWERTARDLQKRGFRVIMPDQIGFGKSSKPVPFHYSFAAMVHHTQTLLDALGVRQVAVVGHSMGGMLATRFALMAPARTSKLVLVNPIGLEDWQHVVPYAPVDALHTAFMRQSPASVRAYMQDAYFDGTWKPAYDDVAALQMGFRVSPDRDRLAWVSALTADMVFTQPVVHDFGRIRVPTLLIIGTRDRTALGKNRVSPAVRRTLGQYGVLGKKARDAIAGAQLVELDGVGHMPQVEAYAPYMHALSAFLAPAPAP